MAANFVKPPLAPWEQAVMDGAPGRAFGTAMRAEARDIRSAVVSELCAYWNQDADEVLDRCRHGHEYSAGEWRRQDRSTPEGLLDFYQHCESWTYDMLWWDYLRSCEFGVPLSAAAADWLGERVQPGSHLQYGADTGTTSIMFQLLGWRSAMADISQPLLDFARWRFAQRILAIETFDLRHQALPSNTYDAVTAVETFAHIREVYDAADSLHTAMRPGAYLFASFDVRESTLNYGWLLYSQPYSLRWNITRAGFQRVTLIAGGRLEVYRRVKRRSPRFWCHLAVAMMRHGPPAQIYRRARRKTGQFARGIVQRWRSDAN